MKKNANMSSSGKNTKNKAGVFQNPKFVYLATKTTRYFLYFLGFPLVALLIYKGAAQMEANGLGKAGYGAVYAILGVWAIVAIAQLIFNGFFKKFIPRAIFATVITAVLLFSTVGIAAAKGKKVVTAAQAKAQENNERFGTNVTVKTYNNERDWFMPRTPKNQGGLGDYGALSSWFCKVYHVDMDPGMYRKENLDGSEAKESKTEKGVWLSPNGLYADGFVFGADQVIEILKTYNSVKAYYASKGEDADAILKEELAKIVKKENASWNEYTATEEYLDQYGPGGDMYTDKGYQKYMLDSTRVNAIMGALFSAINDVLLDGESAIDVIGALTGMANVNTLEGLFGLISKLAGKEVSPDAIMGLLEGFSFYQCPQTKPAFMFVKSDPDLVAKTGYDLKDYALAKYYGQKHGAVIGSVLIPADGELSNGRIGQITMDSQGYPAQDGFGMNEIVDFEVKKEYIPKLYPALLYRRYVLSFGALVVMVTLLCAYLGIKERVYYKVMMLGKKDEDGKIKMPRSDYKKKNSGNLG